MENKKLISIQALRAYACIGILVSHCGVCKGFGAQGVVIFFMLSGFLLVYRYYSDDIDCSIKRNIAFTWGKIKRIYPLHLVMLMSMLPFTVYAYISFHSIDVMAEVCKAISHILLIQAWIPKESFYYSLNDVAWFLSAISFLYFCFPYILRRIKKIDSNKRAILNIVVTICLQVVLSFVAKVVVPDYAYWLTYLFPVYRLTDFYLGCNLGWIFLNLKSDITNNRMLFSIFEMIGIVLFVFPNVTYGYLWSEDIYQVGLRICALMLILTFANNRGVFTAIAVNKVATFVGNISGYIFLVHKVIIRYCNSVFHHFNISNMTIIMILIDFFLSITAAIVWKYIVRYFEMKRKAMTI